MEEVLLNDPIQDKSFSSWLFKSMLLHALIILTVTYSSKVFYQFVEKRKQANIQLVQSSVKVDVVAMPKMTLKELKAIESIPMGNKEDASPDTAPEAKTPDLSDSSTEYVKETKKKNFMDLMKNMAKEKVPDKRRPVKKVSKSTGTKGVSDKELQKLILAGNKLNQGSSLTGSGPAATDAFSRYISTLPDMVRPQWKLPSYLMDQDFKCRIRIFLNTTGRLLKAEIFETSGNKEYDRRALDAVKGSSPFPELAESFKSRGINGDIILGFPL